MFRLLLLVSAAACCASAFVSPFHNTCKHSLVTRQALWRHFVPRSQEYVWDKQVSARQEIAPSVKQGVLASCLALILTVSTASLAVSGGGLDYANLDITGQDFQNNNYKGKDFTQVIAKGTKFAKSNLQGCRFYKAYLVSPSCGGILYACRIECHFSMLTDSIFFFRSMPTFPMPTCVVLHSKIQAWMERYSRIQMHAEHISVNLC